LDLTGVSSAVLRPTRSDDIELPEHVAEDLTGGVLLLNDAAGSLLSLPYAGDLVAAYDLTNGEPMYPPIVLHRNPDRGLRMATVRVIPGRGVVYLTEASLALFGDDCRPVWRKDEDFQGWTIEAQTGDELRLLAGDWAGREQRQARSLLDGARLGD
jgi:hypothetical protein